MSGRERSIRVGNVSFLNAVPLVEGLAERPGFEVASDVPSVLADRLAAGEYDVGLIPVIEVFRGNGYRIVPNIAIACFGVAWTVKLFSRVPLEGVRRVALDTNSRTSAALARVLLAERYGIEPVYVNAATTDATPDADAYLVIGDPAMRRQPNRETVLDLGEAWTAWTGLPFVFAVWAVRPDAESDAVVKALTEAKAQGLRHIERIAEREGRRRGFAPERCRTYLRDIISYDLKPDHLKGLRRYLELVRQHGLLGAGSDPEELLL
jgi:chorismate dehydratase